MSKTRMTNEEATRLVNLCEKYAWMMRHKIPHLTHEELVSEFQMTCVIIYNKYGFVEPLFKKACHARLVDLVRVEYRYGTYTLEDTALELSLNSCEPNETTASDESIRNHQSIETTYESESLLNELKNYLKYVTEGNDDQSRYVKMRFFLDGIDDSSNEMERIFKGLTNNTRTEGIIAEELGCSNGASSSRYKMIRFRIRLYIGYFMYMNDLMEYLPKDWQVGDEYYSTQSKNLAKAKEYFEVVKSR